MPDLSGAHKRFAMGAIRMGTTAALAGVLGAIGSSVADSARAGAVNNSDLAAPHDPSGLIVAYEPDMSGAARAWTIARAGLPDDAAFAAVAQDVDRITVPTGIDLADAIARLESVPGVRYAEPDYWIEPVYEPDDPYFTDGRLWGMYGDATSPSNRFGSAAGEAWSAGAVGSRAVFVGIVDEGFDVRHPDLAVNAWTTPFDPVDGRDNDNNGYVDDVHGWDFFHGDNTIFDGRSTNDVDSHGTHVAGIVGAQGGNNAGVAGVNWAVTMISAKFLGPTGGSSSGAIRALDYLTDLRRRHGLNIVATNNSWGYARGYGQALVEAIGRGGDAGILFVAAVGNNGNNNDNVPFNPASFRCTTRQDDGGRRGFDCITSVAAITASGARASFSNFGAMSVDLGAPGAAIRSTYPNGRYGSLSGTSMATPHVTGAIALCAATNPALDAQRLQAAVLGSTAATSSLEGKTVTGGRLDIGAMLAQCDPPPQHVVGSPGQLAAALASGDSVRLDWADGAANERAYEIQRALREGEVCDAWQRIDRIGPDSVSHQVHGLAAGVAHCFRVGALGSLVEDGWTVWSNEVSIGVPASVPGAPGDVRAVGGNAQATISWAAPLSDGGSPIIGYGVRSQPGDASCTTAGELSCTVSGLVNGTAYMFTVRALNSVGSGPESTPSPSVVPQLAQFAPEVSVPKVELYAPQTIGTHVFVRVRWPAVETASGQATYELQRRRGSGSWRTIALPSAAATSVDVALVPDATYTFRVRSTVPGMLPGAWATSEPRAVAVRQEGAAVYTGAFPRVSLEGASGGYVRKTDNAGSKGRLSFSGRAVAFVTTVGPARGRVDLWLDGELVATLDLYASNQRTRRVAWATSLVPGQHVLAVRPTGTKHAAALSARIDVDAFLVLR